MNWFRSALCVATLAVVIVTCGELLAKDTADGVPHHESAGAAPAEARPDHGHDGAASVTVPHEATVHGTHSHSHHSFELGLAPGLVYVVSERELTGGIHLHLVKALTGSSWAFGLGLERLLDQHAHNTIGAVLQYGFTDSWSTSIGPGLTFSDAAPGELEPSLHLETAYGFTFGDVHVGPSLELALDPEDSHVTVGIHVGYGF